MSSRGGGRSTKKTAAAPAIAAQPTARPLPTNTLSSEGIALSRYSDARLMNEYEEMARASMGGIHSRNAAAAADRAAEELYRRGITEIPNIFGPIPVKFIARSRPSDVAIAGLRQHVANREAELVNLRRAVPRGALPSVRQSRAAAVARARADLRYAKMRLRDAERAAKATRTQAHAPRQSTTANRPVYDLTPKQYHDQQVRATMKEYGITRKEAQSQPRDTNFEHYQAIRAHLSAGGTIRSTVLDALTPGERRSILHDYPGRHPNYLPPETRKVNQAAEAETRAARKRGRARASA